MKKIVIVMALGLLAGCRQAGAPAAASTTVEAKADARALEIVNGSVAAPAPPAAEPVGGVQSAEPVGAKNAEPVGAAH